MERLDSEGLTAPLARRVGPKAGAVEIAAAMTAILQQIDAALVPVIGTRGVAALHKRSVHLACRAQRWLSTGQEDPAALVDVLAQRSAAEAQSGAAAYLRSFHGLLTSLIGSSLTERLLHAVWGPPSESTTRVTT